MSSTIRASAGWIRVSAAPVSVRSRAPGIPESFSLGWNCSFRNEDPPEQEGETVVFLWVQPPGPVTRRIRHLQLPVRIRSKAEEANCIGVLHKIGRASCRERECIAL